MMELLRPGSLYLLGLIPLIVAAYIWSLKRRRRNAIRYSSLSLVRDSIPRARRWRRHLPFAVWLMALPALMLAAARPVTQVSVPSYRSTVLLAIDVSPSMCSTDIAPNRLEAAKQAALSFVANQDRGMQIGLVAFAGFAELVQPPTQDRELLRDAIERLTTARRTAIGSAILKSIEGLAEFDPSIPPLGTKDKLGLPVTGPPATGYAPAIIVLLTDGVSNSGPMPLQAAQEAVARGVRIYTIGFGTKNAGSMPDCSPGANLFSFGGLPSGGTGSFDRGVDEVTLKRIAEMTGGKYYAAKSAGELQKVFENLPTHLITTQETMEVTALFTAIGAALAALAILLGAAFQPLT